MTITIRLFAMLRDRAGVAHTTIELPIGATVADASGKLTELFPSIKPFIPKAAFAVNQQYVSATTEVHDGDELALIPPVSGG